MFLSSRPRNKNEYDTKPRDKRARSEKLGEKRRIDIVGSVLDVELVESSRGGGWRAL